MAVLSKVIWCTVFRNLFHNQETKPESRALPRIDAGERIYAVGDIHGRYDLLTSMIRQIGNDMCQFSDDRKNRVVLLGDYIDRGDQSWEVLKVLANIFTKPKRILGDAQIQIDFLAGNHEAAMMKFLRDPEHGKAWLQWGGKQTLASFGIGTGGSRPSAKDLYRMRDELYEKSAPYLSFLENLQPLAISGNVVFVHAGLDPDAPLDQQPEDARLWGRTGSNKPLGLPGYRMVHGHFDAREPLSLPERICVDTGAYYSGCLTAVRLDDEETFLQAT